MGMKRPVRTSLNPKSLSLIGIPKSFINYSIKDFIAKTEELKEVKGFISDYIDNIEFNFDNNKGLFLCGSNGVGKTMLSCIILFFLL